MGDPHLRLGDFSLWVLGREFPDLDDYWDGNWLVGEARFGKPARVAMRGPFLHADELAIFADGVRSLAAARRGTARLDGTEPNLTLATTCVADGRLHVTLDLRPDPDLRSHLCAMDLDQACLTPLLLDLEAMLAAYPVRHGSRR